MFKPTGALRKSMSGRHDRQVRLDGVGEAGQRNLAAAHVLVVGMGGLGCPAADLLVRAGVGAVGLCDFDRVDLTNLHRQTLYTTADVGRLKVDAARDRLSAVDPAVSITLHPERLDAESAVRIVRGYDLVVDSLDDLAARYALSDVCRTAGIPVVQGAVSRWEGQVAVFDPPRTPCYRCLHPAPPADAPTCAVEGVAGPLPALVGAVQAQEALKLMTGAGPTLAGRMWLHDGLQGDSRTITLKRRPGCLCFVKQPVACPLPWAAPPVPEIAAQEFASRRNEFFLVDVREPDEHAEGAIPGARLMPLNELVDHLAEIPQDGKVVCVCSVGGRSSRATTILREHGFDAVNLRGGMRSWMAVGGELA